MKASVIIRTKNEERWIESCLHAVFDQSYQDFEVVLVDNCSTDKTVERAQQFNLTVVSIDGYLPGRALNEGIKHASGEILVFLSAHCIPADSEWLASLIRNFNDPQMAGVYGRQQPMAYSTDLDKRDLVTVFGLDRRVQEKDSFFHNANSAIRRDLWLEVPFDDQVKHIEDRIWAKEMLARGHTIIYEPDASVYHHHGINQGADLERCRAIVRILEQIEEVESRPSSVESHDTTVVIPIKGEVNWMAGRPLLHYTLEVANAADCVNEVVVATDNPDLAEIAESGGASRVLMRPPELSEEFVGVDAVLQYAVNELEAQGLFSSIVLLMEETYPFRPEGLIDHLIGHLVQNGYDSVIPAFVEYRSVWQKEDGVLHRIDEGFLSRTFKEPVYVGIRGLGFATRPMLVREGNPVGVEVGLIEVSDPMAAVEVRDTAGIKRAEALLAATSGHEDIGSGERS